MYVNYFKRTEVILHVTVNGWMQSGKILLYQMSCIHEQCIIYICLFAEYHGPNYAIFYFICYDIYDGISN